MAYSGPAGGASPLRLPAAGKVAARRHAEIASRVRHSHRPPARH
ncbi:hypothetical protein [Nonomuraea jabiensis]